MKESGPDTFHEEYKHMKTKYDLCRLQFGKCQDKSQIINNQKVTTEHLKLSANKHFKGYLHYKTIISQNVSSEAQVKNFLISCKSDVPFSRYSSFYIFNYPMIFQISDVTSIST